MAAPNVDPKKTEIKSECRRSFLVELVITVYDPTSKLTIYFEIPRNEENGCEFVDEESDKKAERVRDVVDIGAKLYKFFLSLNCYACSQVIEITAEDDAGQVSVPRPIIVRLS